MGVQSGYAEQVEFQLSGTNSLVADGFVNVVGAPFVAQDPAEASLTTTYSGSITVDVDSVANPTSIEFVSANLIAANGGNWLPEVGGGNVGNPDLDGDADPGTAAPANYGFILDLGALGVAYGAIRDSVFSLTAAARPVTSGQFDPLGIAVPVTQGVFDANVSSAALGDDAGTDEITDEIGANCTDEASGGTTNRCGNLMGSYAVAGSSITLTLPLDFIIGEGDDVQATFSGTFTATASLGLPGDYNEDGTVNAADYAVWRDGGSPDDSQAGYDLWRANFGNSGSGAGSAAVPEPACMALGIIGLLGLVFARRGICGQHG
jgi:hypothetical protein